MKNHIQLGKKITVLSFLLPSFIGFVIFIFAPLVMAFFYSFTNFSGGPRYKLIGLKNYIVAFHDELFLSSLKLTFKYMIVTVIGQVGIGLALAVLLAKRFKGCSFFRSVFYVPNVLSSVAVGLAFMFIFEAKSGLANQFLASIGLPTSKWLTGKESAMSVIYMVTIWQTFGYYMVLFIGGLQNVNGSLYEAAEMDGAGRLQQFIHVTLPGISPILFYGLTIAVIRGFKVFDYIFVMTGGEHGGGPAGATSVLAFDIYRNAFMYFRFGYASAESVVLLLITFAITMVQQYGQRKWVVYDVV